MAEITRRGFIISGSLGLATLGTGSLVLKSSAAPTESSGTVGSYGDYLKEAPKTPALQPKGAGGWQPTEDNIQGPFYRAGAPFRGKITPPLEPGNTLLIKGRVWGFDTKKPLAGAILDIWQANAAGHYDNDDPANPPARNVFLYRARLRTDENGAYEYETVHPGNYPLDDTRLRPSHIHYLVRQQGYAPLITQLYFRGDPHNAGDPFIKESLIIDLQGQLNGKNAYKLGVFDIVLARA